MTRIPSCGILAGEIEVIGTRCADGGTCHHGCVASCFRKRNCVPLTLSGLTDAWTAPAPVKLGFDPDDRVVYMGHDSGQGDRGTVIGNIGGGRYQVNWDKGEKSWAYHNDLELEADMPVKEIQVGAEYWLADPTQDVWPNPNKWEDLGMERRWLQRGLIYSTRSGALKRVNRMIEKDEP